MKISVVQPKYYAGDKPDEKIAKYLTQQMQLLNNSDLIVLPEYSNAGKAFGIQM